MSASKTFRPGLSGQTRLLTLLLAFLVALPSPGLAQDAIKKNRRWLFGLAFGVGAAIPAYSFTADEGFQSSCSSKGCAAIVAGIIGAGIGFLVGAELDARYSRRMEAGPNLRYTFRDIQLNLVPDRLADFPGGVAVAGLGGARIVFRDGTVQQRAWGVRGIEDIAVLAEQDLLVLSTFSNLITFPVRDSSAQGQVVDERGGGSMEVFSDRLAVAGLDTLRLLSFKGQGSELAVETLLGVEQRDFVTDMAFSEFGRIGWVLAESRLTSYTSNLEMIAVTELPAAGRKVRARGSRLVVAAGTHGAFVLDVADPSAARVVLTYEGVRFAYAADIHGDLLYVAAGPEGVAVVDISGSEPRVVGVARHPRFATDVVVTEGGEIWILDRDGRSVQIAEFGLQTAAGKAGAKR